MPWLYDLQIQGAGTSEVEAISSYIFRLAGAHATSPGKILGLALERFPTSLLKSTCVAANTSLNSFVRPNRTTAAVVDLLARATGRTSAELEPTTFLCLSDSLGRGMQMFSQRPRWCPACIADLRRDGKPYYKLKWQIMIERACDIHQIELRERCRACGADQGSRGYVMDLSVCAQCLTPLTDVQKSDIAWIPSRKDISELIGYVASIGEVRFSKARISGLVRTLHDDAVRDGNQDMLYKVVPQQEMKRAASESHTLTLNSALHVASALGITLLDLLQGNWLETNRQLFFDAMGKARPDPRYKQPHKPIDKTQLLPAMSDALHAMAQVPNPTLRAFARELGVSVGALWYHFPELTREISTQFELARARHFNDVGKKVREAVEDGLKWWRAQDIGPPSKKALLRKLYAESGLPKNELREQIKYRLFGRAQIL